jgi:protein O-mannosyl-transferase
MQKQKTKSETGRQRAAKMVQAATVPGGGLRPWHYALALAAALAAVLLAYEPALDGPFVLDDLHLPFTGEEYAQLPLIGWIRGLRPLLMLSFWVNYQLSGMQPVSYHFLNLLLHVATGGLVFLIGRKLLGRAGESGFKRDALAAFAGGLFLLHPAQTESVAYVASRSEVLSVLFLYAAFAWFLYRRSAAVSWLESVAILALFAAAASTKEHTVVLIPLLLLTDYYWNPGFSFRGIRRNWKLYALTGAGAVFAARMVWHVLRAADTAGFSIKEFTWYQYFFTQCRAIWLYIRLFVLPYGQNIDHDFPISRTLFEHGAIVALAALVALAVAAVYYRRRFPLASYGFLVFLLLLAPTSSFVPLMDPVAEHRLYLPFIGLLLVAVEVLRRWKIGRGALVAALAATLVFASFLTYSRSLLWSSDLALWQDSVSKSPLKSRPQFQLAFAYFARGRCDLALPHYEAAGVRGSNDYRLLVDWALDYSCLGRHEEGIAKLRQAGYLRNTAQVHSLIGMIYTKEGKLAEARQALDLAERIDPGFDITYAYRGALYAAEGDLNAAAAEYRRSLALNPGSRAAQQGLAAVEQRLPKVR